MVLRYVLAVLVTAAAGLASKLPVPMAFSREWPCPIEAQIAPCKCSQDTEYNLHIDCSLANSDEELENIFSSVFPFSDFYELKIIHDKDDVSNIIDEITADTFADLTFERIIITGTQLTNIIDEAFANSHKTLKYLQLSDNNLHTFPFESLALYTSLHTFILDDNKFPVLYDLESGSLEVFSANRNHMMKMDSKSQFLGVTQLRELYLSEIGLTVLKTGLFNSLTQLEVVDFSNNHLEELEAESINIKGKTLKRVIFDNNGIFFMRNASITGLADNALLSMKGNKFEEMQEEYWHHIFDQIKSRESIDLSGNNLVCGCDIDWLFMQYEEEYLCRLTDTSRCATNEQVIFIDVNIFCVQCAAYITECPPQTDCKNVFTHFF